MNINVSFYPLEISSVWIFSQFLYSAFKISKSCFITASKLLQDFSTWGTAKSQIIIPWNEPEIPGT